MKTYKLNELKPVEIENLLSRQSIDFESVFETVRPVLSEIKKDGLNAALKYALKFGENFGDNIKVNEKEFEDAEKELDNDLKTAIDKAASNIKLFHEKQFPLNYEIETMPGIFCSREFKAIESVGLYIPGGSAVLFSTMLMLGIPSKIAGCQRVVVCSPSKNGKVDPALLYAAKICGINEFYKIGGAQAIGLMAYGDSKVPKAYKIFGPGNQFVTAAKMLVSIDLSGCAIDMPAGPSEVLVIADEYASPGFVASDLLSQAEHGSDSQCILIAASEKISELVNMEIEKQLQNLTRKDAALDSLKNSFTLITDSIEDAIEFSNNYAPEHLILNLKDAELYKNKIINAGSVFVGPYSPESAGDYASGTNHTLPTSGYSKMYGGLGVESFMKSITFQQISKEGLKNISNTVIKMAETEKLTAHANAIKIRIENGN